MAQTSSSKTAEGRFFEDFRLGETIRHATPRTLSHGDASLYSALYGGRFAPQSAETFARAIGYPAEFNSTIFSLSTSFSARQCRTSRSMRSRTSAMPIAGF